MTTWINYAETGYDPSDGLLGGRWMFDDERRCQVWVQIEPAPKEVPLPNRICHSCGVEVGPRFRYCSTCSKYNLRESKRLYSIRTRAAA